MPRVNSFSIPADDPERAVKFYRDVFDWRLEEHHTPQAGTKYWLVHTESGSEPGINGALSQREFPGQPIGISIEVPSVDDFAARVEQRGGKLLVRKATIPKVAWFSVCQDSEGNTFVLVQPDPSA